MPQDFQDQTYERTGRVLGGVFRTCKNVWIVWKDSTASVKDGKSAESAFLLPSDAMNPTLNPYFTDGDGILILPPLAGGVYDDRNLVISHNDIVVVCKPKVQIRNMDYATSPRTILKVTGNGLKWVGGWFNGETGQPVTNIHLEGAEYCEFEGVLSKYGKRALQLGTAGGAVGDTDDNEFKRCTFRECDGLVEFISDIPDSVHRNRFEECLFYFGGLDNFLLKFGFNTGYQQLNTWFNCLFLLCLGYNGIQIGYRASGSGFIDCWLDPTQLISDAGATNRKVWKSFNSNFPLANLSAADYFAGEVIIFETKRGSEVPSTEWVDLAPADTTPFSIKGLRTYLGNFAGAVTVRLYQEHDITTWYKIAEFTIANADIVLIPYRDLLSYYHAVNDVLAAGNREFSEPFRITLQSNNAADTAVLVDITWMVEYFP